MALQPIRRGIAFLLNMDAAAWRALLVTLVMFGGVGVIFLFGASLFGLESESSIRQWMSLAHDLGPWALPATVVGFTLFAMLGVPQFVLIAAAVVAFGPWTGFAYSWIGNLLACAVGFYAGRLIGADVIRQRAGPGVNRFMARIAKNGFITCALVRLIPSAPFMVVNMAAGVTGMRFRDFIGGTALGSIPKIALTAFAGNAILKVMSGGGVGYWIALGATAVFWIGAGLWVRRWVKQDEARNPADPADAAPPVG